MAERVETLVAAMILEYLPDASAELYAAAERYESKEEGLGWRFRSEVLESRPLDHA
jgi:hypothetical protein